MGDINVNNLQDAKVAALKFLKSCCYNEDEVMLNYLVIVFMQLINCMLYRVYGTTARLTFKDLGGLCRSAEIKKLFEYRNIICHLHGTSDYYSLQKELKELFGVEWKQAIFNFIMSVVESVEDDTFMVKYAVVQKSDSELMNHLNNVNN